MREIKVSEQQTTCTPTPASQLHSFVLTGEMSTVNMTHRKDVHTHTHFILKSYTKLKVNVNIF